MDELASEEQLSEQLNILDNHLSACIGCGICLEGCATFQTSGWEHQSPRGRLQLASRFMNGQIEPQALELTTFDDCLGCQSCELLCPTLVKYRKIREIVQNLRQNLTTSHKSCEMTLSDYRKWVTLAKRMSKRKWHRFFSLLKSFLCMDFKVKEKVKLQNFDQKFIQQTLTISCIQEFYYSEVIEEAQKFMESIGVSLVLSNSQTCCGAIFERLIHGGKESISYPKERLRAEKLQIKRLKSHLKRDNKNAFYLDKGCSCFLSRATNQYPNDLYEYIEQQLEKNHYQLKFNEKKQVYYQPYCGDNKEENQDVVLRILQKIEGLTVHFLHTPKACCGGYCGETFLHPENALSIGESKLRHVEEGSTIIITSSDCRAQFSTFKDDLNLNLLFPIQLFVSATLIK